MQKRYNYTVGNCKKNTYCHKNYFRAPFNTSFKFPHERKKQIGIKIIYSGYAFYFTSKVIREFQIIQHVLKQC